MRLEIENQIFFFNLVNKGHKVDIFNKEISSIDFFALVGKGLKHKTDILISYRQKTDVGFITVGFLPVSRNFI